MHRIDRTHGEIADRGSSAKRSSCLIEVKLIPYALYDPQPRLRRLVEKNRFPPPPPPLVTMCLLVWAGGGREREEGRGCRQLVRGRRRGPLVRISRPHLLTSLGILSAIHSSPCVVLQISENVGAAAREEAEGPPRQLCPMPHSVCFFPPRGRRPGFSRGMAGARGSGSGGRPPRPGCACERRGKRQGLETVQQMAGEY